MEITYPKSFRKNTRVLDEKEETALVQLLAREMDACKFGVYLALRTGMRIGEICALRWCDISFEAAAISVCHTALRLPRGNACQADPNRSSAAAGDDGGALALSRTELVIGTPKSESSLRLIPLMPDIPTLRHTFATRCVEAGFDVKTLSEILGHSNIGITMNLYVHPNLDLKRENMNRLKSLFPL